MKILQVNASYKPAFIYGGPTMSVSMLCEQLVKAGVTLEVFTTTANGINELPVATDQPINVDGVMVTYFNRITKDHSHFSPALLLTLWKKAKGFDVIHIHAWWNLVSIFSCLIGIMRNIPVLISPRGTLSSYSFSNKNTGIKGIIHVLLGKPLLKRSHLHTTSARECTAILDLTSPKSIYTIPNFVKLSSSCIIEENTDPVSCLKLLFFSRIEEKKGLDILLTALKTVTVPYYLTIAGDGDKDYIDQLKTRAKNENIDDKINWVGFQHENKFKLFSEHHLMVLPSYDENFGNVVIESLSVGTAVLISKNVGLAEYVKENDAGWICQTSASSISEAINHVGTSCKDELSRIRKQAPEIIIKDFNDDTLINKYLDMYDQIILHD